MNDEILTINTDPRVAVRNYEPLPVFDETNPLLSMKMPLFNFDEPKMDPVELAGRLKVTMKLYDGLGLSANQCGLPFRVFVMTPDFVCFNPRIIKESTRKIKDKEGCLSFPGLFLSVDRDNEISVEYENASGRTVQHVFEGITARIFQHELDHMNGIKFTEYVGNVSLMTARRKQSKLIKKVTRQGRR
jgi:peptide deformylase